MIWQLPLDTEITAALDNLMPPELLPLKHEHFKRHVALTLPATQQDEVLAAPATYLRELYPRIYHYGPRADQVGAFGSALLAAATTHGAAVFTHMPNFQDVTGPEWSYLTACLAREFRPQGDSLPDYAGELVGKIEQVLIARGELDRVSQNLGWDIGDIIELTLGLDLIPRLGNFDACMRHYDAYRQRWELP